MTETTSAKDVVTELEAKIQHEQQNRDNKEAERARYALDAENGDPSAQQALAAIREALSEHDHRLSELSAALETARANAEAEAADAQREKAAHKAEEIESALKSLDKEAERLDVALKQFSNRVADFEAARKHLARVSSTNPESRTATALEGALGAHGLAEPLGMNIAPRRRATVSDQLKRLKREGQAALNNYRQQANNQ